MRPLGPNCQALVDLSLPGCCVACDLPVAPRRPPKQKRKRRPSTRHKWTLHHDDPECARLLNEAMTLDARIRSREKKRAQFTNGEEA